MLISDDGNSVLASTPRKKNIVSVLPFFMLRPDALSRAQGLAFFMEAAVFAQVHDETFDPQRKVASRAAVPAAARSCVR